MKKLKIKNYHRSGFVIFFAVMIWSIVAAIALGVANIAFKEIKFSTSAKDTNDSFFAADSGLECALLNDKVGGDSFIEVGGSGIVECQGGDIPLNGAFPSWNFVISRLGSANQSCAEVTVIKDDVTYAPAITTTVISKGRNNGGEELGVCAQNPSSVERELLLNY